ncbi:protein stum-like protein, partial [Huso huso]
MACHVTQLRLISLIYGTVVSGLTLLCCSVPPALTGGVVGNDERLALVCFNLWVGLAQLFTVTFLLIGWVWSITWGVIMLVLFYLKRTAHCTMPTQAEAAAFSTSSESGHFHCDQSDLHV